MRRPKPLRAIKVEQLGSGTVKVENDSDEARLNAEIGTCNPEPNSMR